MGIQTTMSVCELITDVERLEKELKTANQRLESARTRLGEVSHDRCLQWHKLNAITQELSPILPDASQPDREITVPASVVEELRKVLFG